MFSRLTEEGVPSERELGGPGYSRPLGSIAWEVTGVLYRGGVIKLILAMLTVNHYIYALKLMPLTRYRLRRMSTQYRLLR